MQLRREALGTWRHHGRFSANSANLLSYWVVGNNVDIHRAQSVLLDPLYLPIDKNYHLTGIVVGWPYSFSTCLGSLQFWSSSRHQMLLGSLNDNCIFVLRIRWVDLICCLESYFIDRNDRPFSYVCTIPKTNLSFYPNHLLTGICRHLAFFVGTFFKENTYLRYKKTYYI